MTTFTAPDWLSHEFLLDPYPVYAALREREPVYHDAERRRWLLTRYHDVAAVLRDDVQFTAQQHEMPVSMLVSDPPQHTRLRNLVSKPFTPKAVRAYAPMIQRIVDDLLDAMGGQREVDVIAQFAYPLPITVIAEMLGVEQDRRAFFHDVSSAIAVSLGPITDPVVARQAGEASAKLSAYFRELIEKRQAEPRDDLISVLLQAEETGDLLSRRELLSMLVLLLVAGHETTVNLIGNGTLALLRNPDQLTLLRSQPDVIGNAIEELLRYDSPVQFTRRIVLEPVEIDGHRIERGSFIFTILGAANHDPEHFGPDADSLDLTRRDAPHHISFGGGIHHCLGAVLARAEARIAIGSLASRFPELAIAAETQAWNGRMVLRGLDALPVSLR
jgi:cytochrome P450